MKITFEGEALEFAALVNEVSESSAPAVESDTDEIVAAFKKMTLERIRRLETYTGQNPDEIRAVLECVDFITALELEDDSTCAAI